VITLTGFVGVLVWRDRIFETLMDWSISLDFRESSFFENPATRA
jgi:hypothetical protein